MTTNKTTIKLHNSKTRQKEVFEPIDPQNVRMYVCGPTVYDRAHIGNARPVVVFDVLNRLLRHVYGETHVTYVRNFTDVDDKINARAAESGRSIGEITAETTQWYLDDMAALGAREPDHMPRATQYIPQMVAMIEKLIADGFAYVVRTDSNNPPQEFVLADREALHGEHALFEVEKYERYGQLSGQSTDEMIAGSRGEKAPGKRGPSDFVLWKPSTSDLPGWDSPWGRGRPGWHIECSAMSKALLGDTFDIHGGGRDLMFPHHENEIAQSCCANGTEEMARYWLHNEMLQVEGKKMSKSLGNFFTVRDLLDGHDGMPGVPGEVIRFVFLSTHYRKPMDWTAKKAEEAEKTLRQWRSLANRANDTGTPDSRVVDALAEDLNTWGAIAVLHELAKGMLSRQRAEVSQEEVDNFAASAQFLGLLQDNARMGSWVFDGAVEKLAAEQQLANVAALLSSVRKEAMETKDFSEVDRLKSALTKAGVEVRMSKAGVELLPAAGFDPSKLEGLL